MVSNIFNHRVAKNFIPLPPINVPKEGDLALDFQLPNIRGTKVKLSDYRGKKQVVLVLTRIFTEKLFCPYCYPHIKEFNQQYEAIKNKNAELLMITSTDKQQTEKIINNLQLSYPLLFNPSCSVFHDYGVGQALGAPLPAQFIVNKQGYITFRHIFSFTDGHANIQTILNNL